MKVFGLAGWSGSGKTSLIEQLIPELARRGLSVSVIKHAHKGLNLDQSDKDSQRWQAAGGNELLLSCPDRWALLHDLNEDPEPSLAACLARFSPCDLVLVEGFKQDPIPKIEVFRAINGKPLLAPDNPYIVAIATDSVVDTDLPVLDLNAPVAIAAFILSYLAL